MEDNTLLKAPLMPPNRSIGLLDGLLAVVFFDPPPIPKNGNCGFGMGAADALMINRTIADTTQMNFIVVSL